MFHTLNIVQRDTRHFPYLVSFSTLYSLLLSRPRSLHLFPICHFSIPTSSSSSAAAAVSLSPVSYMPACFHQTIPNLAPGVLSVASHRSRSGCVAMYCPTVFCLLRMYSPIASNPASSLADAAKVYSHLPYARRRRSLPVNSFATWSWNPPRTWPMRGVTTNVSAPKSSTN